MDAKLKMAIYESGLFQNEVAKRAGLNPSIISLAVRGRYILDAVQRARISKALGRPQEQIFTTNN